MKEWQIQFCLENSTFEISFLDNQAISGPGKCKIRNLYIKMSKTPKYGLWEMMGSFYLCFQDISMKLTWSYWALCIIVSTLFRQLSALFQHILALKIVSALIQQSAKKCPPYYSSQKKSVRLIPTSCLSALILSGLIHGYHDLKFGKPTYSKEQVKPHSSHF